MAQSKTIYLGIKGSVLAVDATSGAALWTAHLKGSDFVNVVLDGEHLFAATHGEIFCLNPMTGQVRWHNPLKGYGWGLVSITGEGIGSSPFPVFAHEKRRREEQAASNSAASNPG